MGLLRQKWQDKNKVYSFHESKVVCISKRNEHKKYEFGSKVSSGVTIAGMIARGNRWMPSWNTSKGSPAINSKKPSAAGTTRGRKEVLGTAVHTPKIFSSKLTNYRKAKLKEGFTKRAVIEL